MKAATRAVVLGVTGALVMSGCATKGALRRGLAEQSAALQTERAERIAADNQAQQAMAALRSDLLAMREDFGAKIVALEDGMSVTLPVHFGFNEAAVRDTDHAALDRFVQAVQRSYPGARITVAGFADPAGSARYNQALSQRRAESVRSYLTSQGLAQDQLQVVGYGEQRPVVPGAAGTRAGAELNRRVVFVIESPASVAPVAASALQGR